MIPLRLTCDLFHVDVRVREINRRFIASADTPDGPTLGPGTGVEVVRAALLPFDGVIDELLGSLQQSTS